MFGYDPVILAAVSAAVFVGGVVKGITGIGLPIVTIAILLNILPPVTTLAVVVIPILVTNLWQAFRTGIDLGLLKRFGPMAALFLGFLITTAMLVTNLDTDVLFAILGIAVATFALSSLFRPRPHALKPETERWAGPLAGALGGMLGGVSTIWGPPMMMYLILLKLPKDDWIRTVGLIWFLGALPLTAAYWANGVLNAGTAPLSAYACLPGMLGIVVGERVRDRIDQDLFRKIMLVALFLIGLNLIRQAVFDTCLSYEMTCRITSECGWLEGVSGPGP